MIVPSFKELIILSVLHSKPTCMDNSDVDSNIRISSQEISKV